MTTIETANRTKTTYFVEYICDDINNTYWQLVRSRDAAILAAHKDLNDIYAHCFICGINKQDVTIWGHNNEKIMSYHTVVSTKKNAVGLVRFFRVHCLLAKFEEIPVQYRIATDRRYMVFVLNPGQADPAFVERCEKIIAKYNQ